MNREIKFRVWAIAKKEMIQPACGDKILRRMSG